MSVNDPVSDMLARIRNSQMREKETVELIYSKLSTAVLDVMKKEGFIVSYEVIDLENNIKKIVVTLKYYEGQPVIRHMKRVSTPGRRIYKKAKDLLGVFSGLGIEILSTPNGVLSDHEARTQNVGGEVLCIVY